MRVWNNVALADTVRLSALKIIAFDVFLNSDPDSTIFYCEIQLKFANAHGLSKYEGDAHNTLGLAYSAKDESKLAEQHLLDALSIYKKNNFLKGQATAMNNLGNVYERRGNFELALDYEKKSFEIRTKLVDKKGIATTLSNMVSVYRAQGDNKKAIETCINSLKLREEINDIKGIASCHNQLGLIYRDIEDYEMAIKYFKIALELNNKLKDKRGLAYAYNNLAIVYDVLAVTLAQTNKPIEALAQISEAIRLDSLSLELFEAAKNKKGMLLALGNMGVVETGAGEIYLKIQQKEKAMVHFEKASLFYKRAIEMTDAENDYAGLSLSHLNLGSVFIHMKKLERAKPEMILALALAKKSGTVKCIEAASYGLYCVYKSLRNFEEAYSVHEYYTKMRDSLMNGESKKEIIKQDLKFEFEKQKIVAQKDHEKKLAIAQLQARKQKIISFLIGGLLFILLGFGIFVFKRLRVTRKQKQIIELQKVIVEAKQKEILDSIHYAKRIQTALLTSNKYIERQLKKLNIG